MTNEQLYTEIDIAWAEFIEWLEGEALESEN